MIPIDLEEIKKAERNLPMFSSLPPHKVFDEPLKRDFVSRDNVVNALVPCGALINNILNKEKAIGVQRLRRAVAVGVVGDVVYRIRKTIARELGYACKNLTWQGAFPAVRIDETVVDPDQQACIRPIRSLDETNLESILTSTTRECLADKICENLVDEGTADKGGSVYLCVWDIYRRHHERRRARLVETPVDIEDFRRSFYILCEAKLLDADLITLTKP
eukprot:gene7330-9341_t